MSHTLLILKIYTTFKDVQMILKRFFDISTGFRFSKNQCECSVHSCSCPWSRYPLQLWKFHSAHSSCWSEHYGVKMFLKSNLKNNCNSQHENFKKYSRKWRISKIEIHKFKYVRHHNGIFSIVTFQFEYQWTTQT